MVIVRDLPVELETTYFKAKIINGPTFLTILLIHINALIGIFHFSWQGLACLIALYCYTGCVDITFCYHHMLTNRGFQLNAVAKWFANHAGAVALQGRPLDWAMNHRIHHERSGQKVTQFATRWFLAVSFFMINASP